MAVVSSMHREPAPAPQAGCNADQPYIQPSRSRAQAPSIVRQASLRSAFLLALRLTGLLLIRRLSHVHLLPLFKRIRRVDDNTVRGLDPPRISKLVP